MADVERVTEGTYVVRVGDDPMTVADRLLGNPLEGQNLIKVNPLPWEPGDRIVVPNKKGRVSVWRATANGEWPAESEDALIRRMFNDQPVHIFYKLFLLWNNDGNVEPGSKVFIPER